MGDERDVGLDRERRYPIAGRPARFDRADVLDGVVLGDLEQPLEHRRRRVERDDRTAGRIERARDRECISPGPGADIEPRLAGSDEPEQRAKDGVVRPGRVGPEERIDRRIEVGPIGDLADPFDLVAVGPHAGRPDRLDRPGVVGGGIHIEVLGGRVPHGDLGEQLGVRHEHWAEAAVAGRFGDQGIGRRPKKDGVAAAIARVDRDHDRSGVVGRRLHERLDHGCRDERLVAEGDEDGPGVRTDRLEAELERSSRGRARVPD